jgi:hypothetical protein
MSQGKNNPMACIQYKLFPFMALLLLSVPPAERRGQVIRTPSY